MFPELIICHPLAAWAFLSLPVLCALYRRRTGERRLGMLALRGVALSLLTAALMEPAGLRPGRPARDSVFFLVDVSRSVDPVARDRALELVQERLPKRVADRVGAHAFAFGDGCVEFSSGSVRNWKDIDSASDLGAALRQGPLASPSARPAAVFLLTDGNDTAGDSKRAARQLGNAGVPVYPVTLPTAPRPPLTVSRFDVPERAFVGDKIDIAATVLARGPGPARVTIQSGNDIIQDQVLNFRPGPNPVSVTWLANQPGFRRFGIRVQPPSTGGWVGAAAAVCQVCPVRRVLLVSGEPSPEGPLVVALRRTGVPFDRIVAPDFPASSGRLAPYATVILDDAPAPRLPAGSLDLLESFVKDRGGGLLMLGGPNSFAAGEYAGTPVERALPVKMVSTPEKRPVVLMIDNSWSMAGWPLAEGKRAFKQLTRALSGRTVALYRFAATTKELIAPVTMGPDYRMTDACIDAIRPMGGTDLHPPLDEVKRLLATGARNDTKHAILLSDGEPEDESGLLELADSLRAHGVHLNTVRASKLPDRPLLSELAQHGGGKYFQVRDMNEMEIAFKNLANSIVAAVPLVEARLVPRIVSDSTILRGFSQAQIPALFGYVACEAKKRAQVVMTVADGEPLLTTWRYGLGLGVALATDLRGNWSKDWVRWAGFPRFVIQLIKACQGPRTGDLTPHIRVRGNHGHITVDAVGANGKYLSFLPLSCQLTSPDRTAREVHMIPSDPGRYEASFDSKLPGLYTVEVSRKGAPDGQEAARAGAMRSHDPELEHSSPDTALLREIAALTGGRCLRDLAELAEIAENTTAPSREAVPLAGLLATLALLVYFLEVVLRRLASSAPATSHDPTAILGDMGLTYLQQAKELERKGRYRAAAAWYQRAEAMLVRANRSEDADRVRDRYERVKEKLEA